MWAELPTMEKKKKVSSLTEPELGEALEVPPFQAFLYWLYGSSHHSRAFMVRLSQAFSSQRLRLQARAIPHEMNADSGGWPEGACTADSRFHYYPITVLEFGLLQRNVFLKINFTGLQ